jgi:hypothetical protein
MDNWKNSDAMANGGLADTNGFPPEEPRIEPDEAENRACSTLLMIWMRRGCPPGNPLASEIDRHRSEGLSPSKQPG